MIEQRRKGASVGTSVPVLLMGALFSAISGGCGGSKASVGASRSADGTIVQATSNKHVDGPRAGVGDTRAEPLLVNDHDNDPTGDGDPDDRDGTGIDDDRDSWEDNLHPGNNRYHDSDDADILAFGKPASAADDHSVAVTVKRYYAAAAADDGGRACAMLVLNLVRSVVEDYGEGFGPRDLHGRTCGTVMSRLFRHDRKRYSARFTVTGVRVNGAQAYALLGSHVTPAGYVILKREGRAWKVASLVGGPLP